jgi:WD repeat-containing protein 19
MKEVFRIGSHLSGPIFFAWQKTQGNYLATTGVDNFVRIYNRHGEKIEDFSLPGACTGFGWDQDGDILSIVNDKSGVIFLWDANNRKLSQIDSGFRDTLTFMVWSKVDSLLAIGTVKGNLLIYNHRSAKKIPILGKHTKRITCGAWSKQNMIALGSADQTITISTVEGDTIRQIPVGGDIDEVLFSEMKTDEKSSGENTVSLIKNKKHLYLNNITNPDNPVELSFQSRYGDIVTHRWYGDGYILLGFQRGYFVSVSTHAKEIGQEVFQVKDFQDHLCSIAVSPSIGKVASAGDNSVKLHELGDLAQVCAILTLEGERSLDRIGWTEDGQLLAVSTPRGSIHIFLTKLPVLGSACHTRIAYLTSLLEITIQDDIHREKPLSIPIEVEPSFIALGTDHLIAGMNNRAWFYSITDRGIVLLKEHEYMGTVQDCRVNASYVAARFDGKISLHTIEELPVGESTEKESRLFPEKDAGKERITCHDLTHDFLIYGTDKGKICFFQVEEWTLQ